MSNPEEFRGAGKYIVEMFDPEFVELQKELMTGYHPKLEKLLEMQPQDIDVRISIIAAYCEIVLDGIYTIADRAKLCGIMRERLIPLRENPNTSIVVIESSPLQ